MNITIIGKGILGLSIAEFFSRADKNVVQILSSALYPAASCAAAANLATKGQVFARDPHFDLKLTGARMYRSWLTNLRRELGERHPEDLSNIYSFGIGRDLFSTEDACLKHWKRIQQSPIETAARGLPAQQVSQRDHLTIDYNNEAWVDANELLIILEKVCSQRGVAFCETDALNLDELQSMIKQDTDHLILAAGSMTTNILCHWQSDTINALFKKKRRWSYGATLEISNPPIHLPTGVALLELVPGNGPLEKITFSGNHTKLYCSSVSVKCTDLGPDRLPAPADRDILTSQKKNMIELFEAHFGFSIDNLPHTFRWGLRLGFGHSELFVDTLPVPKNLRHLVKGSCLIAAGAHKSGYLFAPCIGAEVMQKMQPS